LATSSKSPAAIRGDPTHFDQHCHLKIEHKKRPHLPLSSSACTHDPNADFVLHDFASFHAALSKPPFTAAADPEVSYREG
jgi:hypothetical protein